MINADEPIYPVEIRELRSNGNINTEQYNGLTKREYFAGIAMQGLSTVWASDARHFHEWVKRSVIVADMLLVKLSKEQNDPIDLTTREY